MTGNVQDDHLITIGGSAGDKPVKLVFDRVADTTINSARGIASLVATEWIGNLSPQDAINAPYVTSVQIKGDKKRAIRGDFGANITTTDATKPLNILNVAGRVFYVDLAIAGNIGTFTAGAIEGSVVSSGWTGEGIPAFPEFSNDLGPGTIGTFTLKGLAGVNAAFNRTHIFARNLGKFTLGVVDPDSFNNPFGLAATAINSVKFTRDGTSVSLSKLTTVGDFDTDLLDTFVIRIVGLGTPN